MESDGIPEYLVPFVAPKPKPPHPLLPAINSLRGALHVEPIPANYGSWPCSLHGQTVSRVPHTGSTPIFFHLAQHTRGYPIHTILASITTSLCPTRSKPPTSCFLSLQLAEQNRFNLSLQDFLACPGEGGAARIGSPLENVRASCPLERWCFGWGTWPWLMGSVFVWCLRKHAFFFFCDADITFYRMLPSKPRFLNISPRCKVPLTASVINGLVKSYANSS